MINRYWLLGAMGSALLLAGVNAGAEEKVSLKEKKYRAEQLESFKEDVDATNTACGTSLTADIQFAGFSKAEPEHNAHSVSGFCAAPLTALRTLCADATAKEAIQKDIKKLDCSFGGAGKRAISLKGGTLVYVVDWEAANSDDYVKDFIEKSL